MTHLKRKTVVALVALIPLGLALPVLAQRGGEQGPDDLDRAREMAMLVRQGQLSLNDAAMLAERHVKGTALKATCEIMAGQTHPKADEKPANREKPGGPSAGEQGAQPAGKHLMYEVCCFANDTVQAVIIDGSSKKVIEVKERKSLNTSDVNRKP